MPKVPLARGFAYQHGISIYVYVLVCNEICYIQTGIDVDRKIQNGTLYISVILWSEPQHY